MIETVVSGGEDKRLPELSFDLILRFPLCRSRKRSEDECESTWRRRLRREREKRRDKAGLGLSVAVFNTPRSYSDEIDKNRQDTAAAAIAPTEQGTKIDPQNIQTRPNN